MAGLLTSDIGLGTQTTTFSYDSAGSFFDAANEGQGRIATLDPAATQGLQTSPAEPATMLGVAIETDPAGRVSTYSLDSFGEQTTLQTPDGGIQTWQRRLLLAKPHGLHQMPLGRVTTYDLPVLAPGDGESSPR